jgi:hypothetical protein
LAALLLPALARAKEKARTIACINNERQLLLAWKSFADDNDDVLPAATKNAADSSFPPPWVLGWLDQSKGNPDNWDTSKLKASPLYVYLESVEIFRCPADRTGRPRSYSVNGWFGGPAWPFGSGAENSWWVFKKTSDVPDPTQYFVFVDEDATSINDGFFATDPTSANFVSRPATYHNQKANFAFPEGHVETVRADVPWLQTHATVPLEH